MLKGSARPPRDAVGKMAGSEGVRKHNQSTGSEGVRKHNQVTGGEGVRKHNQVAGTKTMHTNRKR